MYDAEIKTLISEFEPYRMECCPDLTDVQWTPRNESVLSILGTYPVYVPDTVSMMLSALPKYADDVEWYRVYLDLLGSLTSEEVRTNCVDPIKYAYFLEKVIALPHVTKRPRRSPKLSNLLMSDFIPSIFDRNTQIDIFNARAITLSDLELSITSSPRDLIYCSVDADYSSCLNWKKNDDYGTTSHNCVHKVWSHLEDPTLAVAYLYERERKVARALVRAISSENRVYVYVHKVYARSFYGSIMKSSLSKLTESLPENVVVPLFESNNSFVDKYVEVPAKFTLTSFDMEICDVCEGSGLDSVEQIACDRCDNGYITSEEYGLTTLPYEDHGEVCFYEHKICFKIPKEI